MLDKLQVSAMCIAKDGHTRRHRFQGANAKGFFGGRKIHARALNQELHLVVGNDANGVYVATPTLGRKGGYKLQL